METSEAANGLAPSPQDTETCQTASSGSVVPVSSSDSTPAREPSCKEGRPGNDSGSEGAQRYSQAGRDEPDGLRKAAVLLASLPEADAEYLLRQLDEPQLISIAKAAKTAPFRSLEQHQVLREMLNARKRDSGDGAESKPAAPTRADSAARLSRKAFAPMSNVPVVTLVRLLTDELPQTIAVVLANMEPRLAAEVLERLPTEKQLATTMRIAQLNTPDPLALAHVAAAMAERLEEINSPPSRPIGGPVHVARIFRHLSSATEKALLANVSHESGDLVKSVSRHLAVLRQLDATNDSGIGSPTKSATVIRSA